MATGQLTPSLCGDSRLSEKSRRQQVSPDKVGNFSTSEFKISQLNPPNQASRKQIPQASIKPEGRMFK